MSQPDWATEPTAEWPTVDDRTPLAQFEGWETTEEKALIEMALRRALRRSGRVIEGGRERTS